MTCPICRISCISQLALAHHVEREHPPTPDAPCDVRTTGWGQTLVVFELVTDTAKKWTDDYVDAEPYQWLGSNKLCVEHRYAEDIANIMREAGLEVR